MAIELNARLSAYTKAGNGRTPTNVHLYQHCLIVSGFFGNIPQGESSAEYKINIITNIYLSTNTKITEDNIKDLLYTNNASDIDAGNKNLIVYNGVSTIRKSGEAEKITSGSIGIFEDENNVKQLCYFDMIEGPLQAQPNQAPIIIDTVLQII